MFSKFTPSFLEARHREVLEGRESETKSLGMRSPLPPSERHFVNSHSHPHRLSQSSSDSPVLLPCPTLWVASVSSGTPPKLLRLVGWGDSLIHLQTYNSHGQALQPVMLGANPTHQPTHSGCFQAWRSQPGASPTHKLAHSNQRGTEVYTYFPLKGHPFFWCPGGNYTTRPHGTSST